MKKFIRVGCTVVCVLFVCFVLLCFIGYKYRYSHNDSKVIDVKKTECGNCVYAEDFFNAVNAEVGYNENGNVFAVNEYYYFFYNGKDFYINSVNIDMPIDIADGEMMFHLDELEKCLKYDFQISEDNKTVSVELNDDIADTDEKSMTIQYFEESKQVNYLFENGILYLKLNDINGFISADIETTDKRVNIEKVHWWI
jgi:hypothetical protein